MGGVQPVRSGPTAQRFLRPKPGIDIVVAALAIKDAAAAGPDRVIAVAAIDGVASAARVDAVIAIAGPDIVVARARVHPVIAAIGIDPVGARCAGDDVVAIPGHEVFELGKAFAGIIGRAGHHVDGVATVPVGCVKPVRARPTAQRFLRSKPGIDIIVARAAVIEARAAGPDRVIARAAPDRVTTAIAAQTVVATEPIDQVRARSAGDCVIAAVAK